VEEAGKGDRVAGVGALWKERTMVGRNAAARVGVGLLQAVVAATRRAAGRRSSMVMVKMNVVERRNKRRKGREGMLVRRLVGRAAAQGRGRNVFARAQCLVWRPCACLDLRPTTTSVLLLTQ